MIAVYMHPVKPVTIATAMAADVMRQRCFSRYGKTGGDRLVGSTEKLLKCRMPYSGVLGLKTDIAFGSLKTKFGQDKVHRFRNI